MALLNAISVPHVASYLLLHLAIYFVFLTVYRVWFSPFSRFPGSPLAKASFWYEFYYDWVKPEYIELLRMSIQKSFTRNTI
ncbi:uncharacterized protein BDV17DRAFT_287252 [Aspergillus undulatus]|uniref:uncharacterized protein n=1 Tax=Aspergillus undulatus TaxID=1810928 RepID=UPI003CCE2A6D